MIKWIVSSSALILAVIAIRHLLKGKISLRIQYALWFLVAVRLIFPVNFGTSFLSIEHITEKVKEQPSVQAALELSEQTITITSYEEAYKEVIQKYEEEGRFSEGINEQELQSMEQEASVLVEESSIAEMIEKTAFFLWRAGMLVFVLVFFLTNFVFGWKVKKNRYPILLPNISLQELHGTEKSILEKLPIYVSNSLETPCLFGILKPAIYVTPEVAKAPSLLRHSVFHELTHYMHGDVYWSVVRCMCLILHWYNPLVWWAAILSKQDAELACDEGTIQRLGEKERIEYGKTLIKLTCEKRQELFVMATTMTSGKNKIKERIRFIAKKTKMKQYMFVIVLTIGVLLVGCTFTGKEEHSSENEIPALEAVIATEEAENQIRDDFYREVPEKTLALAVMPDGISKAGGDYRFIIPEDQTYWISEYKEMKSHAKEERGWRKGELPQGIWIVLDDEWTEITEQGFIVAFERRVEKEDADEFYHLCIEEAMKYGTGTPLRPFEIKELISAELTYNQTYIVTDEKALARLEKSFSESKVLYGGGACPFIIPLTLRFANGEVHTIYLASDSCNAWINDGVYYTYSDFEDMQALAEFMQDAADNKENTPSKIEVLSKREQVLKGMAEEEIKRLTENIKIANLTMERAYLYEDLFGELADKNSLYWNYFHQKGEILVGWALDDEIADRKKEICKKENLTEEAFYEKYGNPVMDYNRFDGENFIALLEDMKQSVQHEKLRQDMQYMIEETKLAMETHETEHANNIYKVLHDMDYFLLRYGIEEVGVYTLDDSIVSKYYGVLNVYSK